MKSVRCVIVATLLLPLACAHRAGKLTDHHTEPAPPPSVTESNRSAAFPSEWNTAATMGGPGIQAFQCEFPVPSAPAFKGQDIYFWCGVQQSRGVEEKKDFGVLQPVLMFGRDCIQDLPEGAKFGPDNDPDYDRTPYWYYSAQYVFPDPPSPNGYKCTTGTVFKAVPGETLISTMSYDAAKDEMTVRISRRDGSDASNLTVKHPKDDRGKRWSRFIGRDEILLVGALEIPHPEASTVVPPEILKGFPLKARVTSLPRFPLAGTNAWQFEPDGGNTLSVGCKHDSSTLESDCLWKQ